MQSSAISVTPFTRSERKILLLICRGMSPDEMAAELFVSVNTIKTHMLNLRNKTGARNRAHLVGMCFRNNWLQRFEDEKAEKKAIMTAKRRAYRVKCKANENRKGRLVRRAAKEQRIHVQVLVIAKRFPSVLLSAHDWIDEAWARNPEKFAEAFERSALHHPKTRDHQRRCQACIEQRHRVTALANPA